jgi:hypothetical protein
MVTLQIPLIDSIAKEEVKKTMIKQWMDGWMDGYHMWVTSDKG